MSYYRIQINELQNGEKRYIPQKAELRISRSWIQRQEIKWYNIIQEGGRYALSKTTTESYDKEEDALSIINTYRGIGIYEEGKKLKSTTYKMID
jgi:hypothetical protein